jgi:Animal haem peroxidase
MLQTDLETVYGNVNKDLFIGGLAENHSRGAAADLTFQAIPGRQLQALGA